MDKYKVTGMSCAACSARVENAVRQVEGVEECAVNLLTNSMTVSGSATEEEIRNAVEKAGYGLVSEVNNDTNKKEISDNKEINALITRLISSVVILLILMYFSMGAMMWNFPVPHVLDNCISNGVIQLCLSAIILFINRKFFINGVKGVIRRSPNMDTLVALGSGVSFAYSLYSLFAMIYYHTSGDITTAMSYMDGFYFESSAMILTLITVGKTLEAYSKGKTTDAIKSLMALTPPTATVIRNGEEVVFPVEKVLVGDEFIIKSGEFVPVDGEIIKGNGSIDESALTGESIPIDKVEGCNVSQGTLVKSGYLRCRATRIGEDTGLSQIIKMVNDANASKAPISKIADKVSGVFVPVVLTISLITLIVWLALGKDVGFSLSRAITVLVISCPCSLGLATPVAIMVGSGKGAKNGILFKTAEAEEQIGKVDIVVMDKTGTITRGEPSVTDIIPKNGFSEAELLSYAYSLENMSEHPLSKAVVNEAESKGIVGYELTDFETLIGKGLRAKCDKKDLVGGSVAFISSSVVKVDDSIKLKTEKLSREGKTPLLFALNGELIGIIAVADTVKSDSVQAIKELQNMGIKVVMLTGDNENTAQAIGKEVGVDAVIAGVLPDGKETEVKKLMQNGLVAMVGDGINDAPALTSAHVGIAIGAGTDVAIDSADVVLVNDKMTAVSGAVRLGRRVLTNIHENLFWAFIYNIIGIPLAAGLFTSWFGWELEPMFGALAMSLSSFCVVTNALRLNFVKVFDPKHDHKKKNNKKEKMKMTKTIKIEGMMCNHCVATVNKALSALRGVESVEVSLENKSAVITSNKELNDKNIVKAIENAGFKVTEIA